jgi:TorA maturation chaperone TorD
LILRMMEEALPPELRLFNRLMAAEDEPEIESVLQANRELVTEHLVQLMEDAEAKMREEGQSESADHLALVLEKARGMVAPEVAA